jgi:hypothetical protein
MASPSTTVIPIKEVTLSASIQRYLDTIRDTKPTKTAIPITKSELSTVVKGSIAAKGEAVKRIKDPEDTATLKDDEIKRQEFTLFPKLPMELRAKIFKEYHDNSMETNDYRVVEITQESGRFCCFSNGSGYPDIMRINKEGRKEALETLGFVELTLHKEVEQDSAGHDKGDDLTRISENMNIESGGNTKVAQTLFVLHLDNDILCIRRPQEPEDWEQYLGSLEKVLQQRIIKNRIKCVAVNFTIHDRGLYWQIRGGKECWISCVLKFLSQFSSLEMVYIVVKDDYLDMTELQAAKGRRYTLGSLERDHGTNLYTSREFDGSGFEY